MKEFLFQTNINCQRCVRSVTAFIEEVDGLESWDVDLDNIQKPLTARGDQLDPQKLKEAIEEAGFDATPIDLA